MLPSVQATQKTKLNKLKVKLLSQIRETDLPKNNLKFRNKPEDLRKDDLEREMKSLFKT